MNQAPSRRGATPPPAPAGGRAGNGRIPTTSTAGVVSIKRCDFLGGTNRQQIGGAQDASGAIVSNSPGGTAAPQAGAQHDNHYVPIATCELQPVIIIAHDHERFDDDELEYRITNSKMHYRWRRGPARAVCFFHSYRCAKIQCSITLRCFCSYKCFSRGYKQLRRFYLSQGKIVIPRQQNEFTYGVPTTKFDLDALELNRDPDWEHYKLLKSAGLISPPTEEVWNTVAYNREYSPTHNDVGHQLKLDISIELPPNGGGNMLLPGSGGGVGGGGAGRHPHDEEMLYWSRYDSNPALNSELTRIIMTACVLPMVPHVERRALQPLTVLDKPPPPQRVIIPGTPLAEALGIGVGLRARGYKRNNEALREQIREQRIAFLTEHAFAEWGLTGGGNVAVPPPPPPPPPPPLPPPGRMMPNYRQNSAAAMMHVGTSESFSVMTWNVLADIYATSEAYPCSEGHVLSWTFRRERILSEIIQYNPDIVCLQEIQGDHFEEFFAPALLRRGYEGLYKQKTTKLFRGSGKHKGGKYVCDGCATFFKVPKFHLLDHFGIEFARVMPPPAAPSNKAHRNDKRLLKDNVALVLCLEQLVTAAPPPDGARGGPSTNDPSGGSSGKHVLVIANTHILANPEAPDVKIWQANTLTSVLTEYMDKTTAFNQSPGASNPPGLVVCGDFNSTPSSAVYDLVTKGACDSRHPELHSSDVCSWLQEVELGHGLNLSSSYRTAGATRQNAVNGGTNFEPEFTNYTHEYVGCLDYIFFDPQAVRVQSTLDLVTELQLLKEAHALQLSDWALPSPQRPSDHLPLLANFEWNI